MNNIFVLLIILYSPKSLGYVSTIRYYNTLLRSKNDIDSVQQSLFSFLSKQWNDILTLDRSFQIFNENQHHMVELSSIKCKTVVVESSDGDHIYYAVTLPKDRTIDFSKIQSLVKELGIPTANLDMDELGSKGDLKTGIYFGWVMLRGNIYETVISIGWNPFYKNEKKTIEAHLLQFQLLFQLILPVLYLLLLPLMYLRYSHCSTYCSSHC